MKTDDPDYYCEDQIDRIVGKFFAWLKDKNTGPHEWLVALATLVLMFVACVQLAVSCSSSVQTDKIIAASERNALAAGRFATAAEGIEGGIADAVSKLNLQAGALKKSAQQASRLAGDSETANQNVVAADRPWMGSFIAVNKFVVNDKPSFTFVFTNSGRRPAKVESTKTRFDALPAFPDDPAKFYITDAVPSTNFVVPGQQVIAPILATSSLSQPIMDLIQSGFLTYFAFAEVKYTDPRTNESHFTHVCIYFIPKAKTDTDNGYRNCPQYNDAD